MICWGRGEGGRGGGGEGGGGEGGGGEGGRGEGGGGGHNDLSMLSCNLLENTLIGV